MDKINYNPDILSCLANLSNDEVFTPPEIVNKMLDLLPQDLFQNKNITFLDPVCKSGVFLREIAKRLNNGLKEKIPDQQERINHIFKNQLFGIAITELTSFLSRRSVYCSKKANSQYAVINNFDNDQGNIIFNKIEHSWRNGNCEFCGASRENYERSKDFESYAYNFIHTNKPEEIFNMRFDVIIGNPPYQLSDGGAASSAIPIYQKFVQQAKRLNPTFLCMITPSRWFSGGKGLDEFREQMLNDNKIKIIHDFINANECFPGVEIKGGVSFFLWDKNYSGDCEIFTHEDGELSSKSKRPLLEKGADIFIRYNNAIPIFRKVRNANEESFSKIVSSRKPFGLPTTFKGKEADVSKSIKIYQSKGIGYINEIDVKENKQWLNKHKIIVPYAIGSGDSKTDLIKPIYSEPGTCCTETYLVIGPSEDIEITKNIMSYIQTKFFHFMVTLKKNTQHTTKGTYEFVPLQDFNEKWTDEKLYKKYNLSKDEINYIEQMIRPMEKPVD